MNFKRPRRSLIQGGVFILLLIAALVTGYLLNWFSTNTPPVIVLPSPPLTAPPDQSSQPTPTHTATSPTSPMTFVDVTVDNVQQIVESLSRPSEYQCVWKVEWFWAQGSASSRRMVFVRDGYTRTDIYDPDDSVRHHQITGGGRAFIFSQGFWQPEQGDFNADNEASLPAYEIINTLDKGDILDAGFLEKEGLPCIYVAFRAGEARHVDAYWLSYNDGLPIMMERSVDGVTVFRCVRESLELVRPGDEKFRLPNNKFPWDSD